MVRGVHVDGGKILGLLQVLDDYEEAIEYDLIQVGLRLRWLGTEALTWADLWAFLQGLPRTSAYVRASLGEQVAWSVTDHLLAAAVDALNGANWQRQHGKGQKPKPVERPGQKSQTQVLGSEPIPAGQFDSWWDSH